MKPQSTMTANGSTDTNINVNLNNAAKILDFCQKNNIGVRGHTLVWHAQTPDWFFLTNFSNNGNWVSKSVMQQRIESYIKKMFALIKQQYPTLNLYAYDVVNEATSDDANRTANYGGARTPGLDKDGAQVGGSPGSSPWVQIWGDNSFIRDVFGYARQYAPATCKLFYNDYNEYWAHKRDSIISRILTPLYNDGLLDGMGMQMHVNADTAANAFTGINNINAALTRYKAVGANFEIQMTELDVTTEKDKYSMQNQADKYRAIFQAAVNNGSVSAVCVWGPNDSNTWLGSENRPLLFDGSNNKKAAYESIAGLIPQAQWGDGDNPKGSNPPQDSYGISLSPADVIFPAASAGYSQQETRTITVTNTGNQPTGELVFTDASGFTTEGKTSIRSGLAVGASKTFTIRPSSSLSAGTHSGTVIITGANGISATLNVRFTVISDSGYFFHSTFEDDMDGWSNRGTTLSSISGNYPFKGNKSLSVQGRTAAWNGAVRELNPAAFVPGNQYSFSVCAVYLDGGDTETFVLTLMYTDEAGETKYSRITQALAEKGKYVQLKNKNFAIPAGASNMYLVVETQSGSFSFYIDEAIGAVAGTDVIHYTSLCISGVNASGNAYIEISNFTDTAVSCKGLYLSNAADSPYIWQMPAGVIRPDETIRVIAANNTSNPIPKRMETNFNFAAGQTISLTSANGTVIDSQQT
jgi:GH35 family endo-1,4-beta-xylanase